MNNEQRELLSLSYRSLRELVLNGEIPHLKPGKKVLIDKEDLDQWKTRNKDTGVFSDGLVGTQT